MSDQPSITLTSDIAVRLIDRMGGDHSVVAAAKVSTSGEAALEWARPERTDDVAGLIGYLVKHRHGTPFEHSALQFFVHAPVFVWWEWVRHRIGMSYNLESGRYKVLEPVFWAPRRERPMKPAEGHKSARPKFDPVDDALYRHAVSAMKDAYAVAWVAYQDMIADGIANEVARSVLPFAVYYSGWVTTNPRALMHFISLRTRDDAAAYPSYPQAEIEEAARAAEAALASGWPLTYSAFLKAGRVAP